MKFEVVEARRHMVGRMSRMLRVEHDLASRRVGIATHRPLAEAYDRSYYRKALLIDGKLAALGGVTGTGLAPIGFVWLAVSDRATRYPVHLARAVKRHLAIIMQTKMELHTTLIEGDEGAKRMMIFLGFHLTDEGRGAAAYSRAGRRNLSQFMIDEREHIFVPVGGGFATTMGYHG